MLGAGVLPALVVILLRRAIPESPRWAACHGKGAEAAAITARVLGERVAAGPASETRLPYTTLFQPAYLRRTVLVTVPWFLMDVALYGIGFFTPTILAAMAFTGTSWLSRDIAATEGAAVLDVFLVVGFVSAIWLIDQWGRMRLQLLGFAGMTAGLALLALAAALPGGSKHHLALVFLGFATFNLLVNLGPNATTYLLPAEVFPTSLRASGHGLAAAAGKVGATVGIFLLPVLQARLGLAVTVALVAFACALGFLVTWLLRVETSGRSLEDLAVPAERTARAASPRGAAPS